MKVTTFGGNEYTMEEYQQNNMNEPIYQIEIGGRVIFSNLNS